MSQPDQTDNQSVVSCQTQQDTCVKHETCAPWYRVVSTTALNGVDDPSSVGNAIVLFPPNSLVQRYDYSEFQAGGYRWWRVATPENKDVCFAYVPYANIDKSEVNLVLSPFETQLFNSMRERDEMIQIFTKGRHHDTKSECKLDCKDNESVCKECSHKHKEHSCKHKEYSCKQKEHVCREKEYEKKKDDCSELTSKYSYDKSDQISHHDNSSQFSFEELEKVYHNKCKEWECKLEDMEKRDKQKHESQEKWCNKWNEKWEHLDKGFKKQKLAVQRHIYLVIFMLLFVILFK